MTAPNQSPTPEPPGDDEPWISDDLPASPDQSSYSRKTEPYNSVQSSSFSSDPSFRPLPPSRSGRLSGAEAPLPLVETAFLASAASLMWLVNIYFPPGPLLRILFPLPIALIDPAVERPRCLDGNCRIWSTADDSARSHPQYSICHTLRLSRCAARLPMAQKSGLGHLYFDGGC